MHISFQDYQAISKEFVKTMDQHTSSIEMYLDACDRTIATGLLSGNVAIAFRDFVETVRATIDIPETVSNVFRQTVEAFLTDLHEAQIVDGTSVLYDYGFKGIRDYSKNLFFDLAAAVEKPDYDKNFFLKFYDWIEDKYIYKFSKYIGHCNVYSKKNIKVSQQNLMQYQDVTYKQLFFIKRQIDNAELEFSERIKTITNTIELLNNYYARLEDLLLNYLTSNNIPTIEEIRSIRDSINEIYNSIEEIGYIGDITDEEVMEYIESDDADFSLDTGYTNAQAYMTDVFIEYSEVEMFVFQTFSIAEMMITEGGIKRGAARDDKEFTRIMMKHEILDIMDSVVDGIVYDDSHINEEISLIKKIVDFVKGGGEKWEKLYAGELMKYPRVTQFLTAIENFEEVLKSVDTTLEIVWDTFRDYGHHLQFLDSIEKAYISNHEGVKAAFQEIRALYEKELSAQLKTILSGIIKHGAKAIYKISGDAILGTVRKSIDVVGEATWLGPKTKAQLELVYTENELLSMINQSFRNSIQKLKQVKATGTEEAIRLCIDDVKNNFNVYKTTLVKIFRKMAIVFDGEKGEYMDYCANQISRMRINDMHRGNLMSYDQYVAEETTW